ncbi:hypothetical protein JKY72_04645 [Candidatus Gracilibacteria bacterium]|nr:hypothetical protein [Candidatus Gracilibacteria bacterium]
MAIEQNSESPLQTQLLELIAEARAEDNPSYVNGDFDADLDRLELAVSNNDMRVLAEFTRMRVFPFKNVIQALHSQLSVKGDNPFAGVLGY